MRANRLAVRRGTFLVSLCLASFFITERAQAQLVNGNLWPRPRLFTVSPAGGKLGAALEVVCGGSELELPEQLLFSHPGITAAIVLPPAPKVDPKDPKAQPKPPPPGPPKFMVTIGKDVPLGLHDVRIVTKLGVSNPRAFQIGDLDEVMEKEGNDDVEQAQKVELNTTVNGVIAAATDVDYYSFTVKKGQRVVVSCLAPSIDSKLYPEIKVYNSVQKEIAYNRPLPNADAVTDFTAAEDGVYFVRVNQFTYSPANAECFYRLTITTGPWIDAVFPVVAEPGKAMPLTLYGRNLPGGKIDPQSIVEGRMMEKAVGTVTAPADPLLLTRMTFSGIIPPTQGLLDGFEYRLKAPNGLSSNPVMLNFARDPVILENDANDTPETAQPIKVPCEVAGRMDKPRDRDWYVFDAKKGEIYVIDLISDRLGAPTDLYYSLHNLAAKQEITNQDDSPDNLSVKSFFSLSRDPSQFRFVVPADGKYHILVSSHSSETAGDPRQVYRLRIAPERPDFRLIVMPAEDYRPDSAHINQGGVQYFNVFAQRMDGFNREITLDMEGLPGGITCPPQVLGANQKSTFLCMLATDDAPAFIGAVKVRGTAVVNGQKLVRKARPATITWPTPAAQNLTGVTRLDRSLIVSVRDKAPARLTVAKSSVAVSLGDKVELPTKLIRLDPNFKGNFQVTPVPAELPVGVTFAPLNYAAGKDDVPAVLIVAANAVPGKYNIVLRGFAPIAPDAKINKPVNTIIPSTPVELIVLPKQVATLSVSEVAPVVQHGSDKEIVVKVARLFDYGDSFKVQLILPPTVKGITAPEVVIAPGKDDVKLVLKVAPDAPPGKTPELILKAVAVVNGNVSLTHEAKLTVVVLPKTVGNLSVAEVKSAAQHGTDKVVTVKVARLFAYNDAFKVEMLPDGTKGVTAVPITIPAGQSEAKLTLKLAPDAPPGPRSLSLRATAVVNGNVTLNHEAKFDLLVLPSKVATLTVADVSPAVQHGNDKEIVVKVARLFDYKDAFKVEILPEGTKGVTAVPITIAPGQNEAKMVLKVAADAAPGPRPNLTLRAVGVVNGNVSLNHEAKFNLLVLPSKVATLTLSDAAPTVKAGTDKEIVVKAARLFDYKDGFKVQLIVPDGTKGVTAAETTIAPGQTDGKLLLKIAGDAPVGPRAVIVRAVAVVNGNVTLTHEVKLNVTVTK